MRKSGTWALKGRIVTLDKNSTVLDGFVIIKDELIVGTYENLPEQYSTIETIATDGVIYPGMIDLHNHLAYNMLPLWQVPENYQNRDQWRANDQYKASVSLPIKEIINKHQTSINYAVKYVEGKAILGGITSGQGLGFYKGDSVNIYQGAMRNVEAPGNPSLPAAIGNVNDMVLKGDKSTLEFFKSVMADSKIKCYLHHLCEGRDKATRVHYQNLKDNNLIQKKLAGVHSLALNPEDINEMAAAGAKIVWSPYSNLLLYGKTLNLAALKDSKILFSIGCDWSPSGSKNLLQEIKIAKQCSIDQGNIFSNEELVRAVTINAAKILEWDEYLGSVQANQISDLVVLKNQYEDVYENLINAKEQDIDLVLVDGIARYGSAKLMEQFPEDSNYPQEKIEVNGAKKKMDLYATNLPLNHITFSQSWNGLKTILKDLAAFDKNDPKFPKEYSFKSQGFIENTGFSLVLEDDDHSHSLETHGHEKHVTDAAPKDITPVNSILLDEPVAGGKTYLDIVNNELNLPASIKTMLTKTYG